MRNRSWVLLVAGVVAALWSGGVVAVEQSGEARKLTTNELIYKSSELRELNVYAKTDRERKLGHLNDLIIDSHSGQVHYAILDTGIGGRNVIVPWKAFQLEANTANKKSWLMLNKTGDELKNAQIFDKSKLPDFASDQWRNDLDQFFGVQSGKRPAPSGQLTVTDLMFRASELEELTVMNRTDANAKVGHLSDLIINAHTGQVMYGVLNTGLTGKYVPVPWNVFQLRQDSNKKSFLALNKTTDELKNAPSLDMKTMPDFTSTEWTGSVDRFFDVRTVARPTE